MPRADTDLYVNRDWSQIVPSDSPHAAFKLVSAGKEIPDRYHHLLGTSYAEPDARPSKADLYREATELDIEGRSYMGYDELVAAIEKARAGADDKAAPAADNKTA